MSREIMVPTPENVDIQYELAGAGSRMLAYLLDLFIQLGILIVIMLLIGLILSIPVLAPLRDFLEPFSSVLMYVGPFILVWGYSILFEKRWSGQTPGKRAYMIRVMREGGYPVDWSSVVVRNLLRVVDGMPIITIAILSSADGPHRSILLDLATLPVLISLVCMAATPRYQRLGDLAAGTIVVKQRGTSARSLDQLTPHHRVFPEHLSAYALENIKAHVAAMDPMEYRAIRWFSDRKTTLPRAIRQEAAMRLAVPLMRRLDISPPPGVSKVNYVDLLEYLAIAFELERGAA